MIRSRLVADLRRRPVAALVILASLAAAVATGGAGAVLAVQVAGSSGALFDDAKVPSLVQMHAGDIDEAAIAAFAESRPEVEHWAAVELVGIDAGALELVPGEVEATSAIEYSATTQREGMDLLLDLDGAPAVVPPGGIGLPVDLALERGIEVGDPVTIGRGEQAQHFTVTTLVRDAIMNGPLSSSRRLLVDASALDGLRAVGSGSEWLIEFALSSDGAAATVGDDYLRAGLPSNGPMLDIAIFRIMTGLSDGLIAAGVLLIAGLLALIAGLALSVVVRTAIAGELRQIGVLRAIGLSGRRIAGIVLGGHLALIGAGALLGTLLALAVAPAITEAIRLRLGGGVSAWAPLAAIAVGTLGVVLGAALARGALRPPLRRPALEVMRDAQRVSSRQHRRAWRGGRITPSWWLLGRRELRRSPGDQVAIAMLLLAAVLLAAVPVSLHATLAAPSFPDATGIAVSDLRIDLRQNAGLETRLAELETRLADDPAIAASSTLRTVRLDALHPDDRWRGLNVETGDHSAFPLEYRAGTPPHAFGQLALSELNADALGVAVGDTVVLRLGAAEVAHEVVGVYRDITNGGRTAKAVLPEGVGTPLWTVVLADLTPGADLAATVEAYATMAAPARVTGVAESREAILGPLLRGAEALAWGALVGAAAIVALLAALLLRLALERGTRWRAVAQAIGAPLRELRGALLTQMLLPSVAGIALGAALAPLVSAGVLAVAAGAMGAGGLPLDAAPLRTAVLVPLLFAAIVAAVTLLGTRRVPGSRVARIVAGEDT